MAGYFKEENLDCNIKYYINRRNNNNVLMISQDIKNNNVWQYKSYLQYIYKDFDILVYDYYEEYYLWSSYNMYKNLSAHYHRIALWGDGEGCKINNSLLNLIEYDSNVNLPLFVVQNNGTEMSNEFLNKYKIPLYILSNTFSKTKCTKYILCNSIFDAECRKLLSVMRY